MGTQMSGAGMVSHQFLSFRSGWFLARPRLLSVAAVLPRDQEGSSASLPSRPQLRAWTWQLRFPYLQITLLLLSRKPLGGAWPWSWCPWQVQVPLVHACVLGTRTHSCGRCCQCHCGAQGWPVRVPAAQTQG